MNNPYEAPRATVADYQASHADTAVFLDTPRSRPAGQPVEWYKAAWEIFRKAPGVWIGMTVVLGIAMIAVSMIFNMILPIVGQIIINLLLPVWTAGFLLAAQDAQRGDPVRFDRLFAGFSNSTGQLITVGAIYMVAGLVIGLVAALPFVGIGGWLNMITGDTASLIASGASLGMVGLVTAALSIPLMMAFLFAPALVVFNKFAPVDALRASFNACLKNIVPLIVYVLIGIVIAIVAAIPLGLGFLVAAPVFYASMYTAYRDIFYSE